MRDEVQQALDAFLAGIRHENWYGKTYAQFWEWFDAQTDAIRGMAKDEAEADEFHGATLDVLGEADEAGYAVDSEMLGNVIERYDPLAAFHAEAGSEPRQ